MGGFYLKNRILHLRKTTLFELILKSQEFENKFKGKFKISKIEFLITKLI